MKDESWFAKLTHEQWSKSVGVLPDEVELPVRGIEASTGKPTRINRG